MASKSDQVKAEILEKVREYQSLKAEETDPFLPGQTHIPYAGRIYDAKELESLIDASLEFWLTSGHCTHQFELKLAKYLNVKHCLLTNSGSSANLLAFMALTSPLLKEKKIKRGDEVITVAAGFPTTIAPIVQFGAVPVFVDITLPSYNIDISYLEEARSSKTKAVMIAHTLGNPFDVQAIQSFCRKYDLFLIEDNCDSLGSLYDGKLTGTFGDIGTSSFYPAHHITTGEGGAVYTNNTSLKKILASLRDWGRDCWCPSGKDNTCGKRFEWRSGDLPDGYDHKYIYSHFGYNLKATDLQAAIGLEQVNKLPSFVEARKKNWKRLKEHLKDMEDVFILPEATLNSEPSWFGFALTIRRSIPNLRKGLLRRLESKKIQTRMLFAGNLLKHPCFDEMKSSLSGYRVVGDLQVTDQVMSNTFWVGVYPGLKEAHIDYMAECIRSSAKDLSL